MELSYDFLPEHLRVYELNYELKIRGINTDKRVDTTNKRKYLRRQLKSDLARPGLTYETPNFEFNSEKTEIEESLNSISSEIDDFDGSREEVYDRLNSRIKHVFGRLSRIPNDGNASEEQRNFKGDNIIKVTVLQEDLDEIFQKFKNNSSVLNVSGSQPSANNTSFNRSSQMVCKWGLSFDGSMNKNQVILFLQRVEELRVARNCSKDELFLSASDLFEGVALEWFRSNSRKGKFNNWDNLVAALRKDFLSVDYEDELMSQILNRKQQPNERVIIFISVMENLINNLSTPLGSQEKLKIIRKGLLPNFHAHLALQNITDLNTLSDICRKLEDAGLISKKPSVPGKVFGLYESDSTDTTSHEQCRCSCSQGTGFAEQKPHSSNKKNFKYRKPNFSSITCFNCKKVGHKSIDCPNKSSSIYCYGCKRPGVIKPNCPQCSGRNSKNGPRSGREN